MVEVAAAGVAAAGAAPNRLPPPRLLGVPMALGVAPKRPPVGVGPKRLAPVVPDDAELPLPLDEPRLRDDPNRPSPLEPDVPVVAAAAGAGVAVDVVLAAGVAPKSPAEVVLAAGVAPNKLADVEAPKRLEEDPAEVDAPKRLEEAAEVVAPKRLDEVAGTEAAAPKTDVGAGVEPKRLEEAAVVLAAPAPNRLVVVDAPVVEEAPNAEEVAPKRPPVCGLGSFAFSSFFNAPSRPIPFSWPKKP